MYLYDTENQKVSSIFKVLSLQIEILHLSTGFLAILNEILVKFDHAL